jgi:hypothetical protein
MSGQSTSGTTEVRLLSGHGRPGPAGYTSSRRTPAGDSGVRHAHAVSYAQSQAGGRRQDAPSLAEPRCGSAGNPKDPIRNLTCTILKKCYAHRVPATWANPLRAAGAALVHDLHPADRGPRGTHQGAIIANGNLYCPQAPPALLELTPLSPGASSADTAAHDQQTAELARYKLGVHAGEDADGYRRLACPAVTGKIRCPLRPASMKLDRNRPEILTPPQHPPACCTQQTITAGPGVAPKTRQKHDYPSAAWRISYRRRTAAERLNAAIKDTAVNSIDRGWIRLTGVTPLMLWLACLMVVRNQRILATCQARQHDARCVASGQQPRPRKRRRELAGAAAEPP